MSGPFWQRVAIQGPVETRTASGATVITWETLDDLDDIPARVVSAVSEEARTEQTVIEDAYQVQLAGAYPTIRTGMAVLDGTAVYDIRQVIPPPPFGTPVTILDAVVVAI